MSKDRRDKRELKGRYKIASETLTKKNCFDKAFFNSLMNQLARFS